MLVTVTEILENGYIIRFFKDRKSYVLLINMEFDVGEVFELTELPTSYKLVEVGEHIV